MRLFKPTQFHYSMFNDNGELLVLNTFTGKLYKVHSKNAKMVNDILQQRNIDENKVPLYSLISEKLLVPSTADEYAYFRSCCSNIIHQSELGLTILPTHQCNCRCVYCYENFNGGIMSSLVQDNLIKFVKNQINRYASLNVSWFGGEPLLAMDVIKKLSQNFINLCRIRKKQYGASITTNGTLLTIEVFRELQKCRVYTYQITIDGTKEIHDAQRPLTTGGSSYDLIIDNLVRIKQTIRVNSFKIFVRINLTKSSLNNIDDYIHTIEELFGDDPRFIIHFNVAGNWGGDRIGGFLDELLTQSDNVSDKIKYSLDKLNSIFPVQNVDNSYRGSFCFSPGCNVGYCNHFTIDTNGQVFKCAQIIRDSIPKIGDLGVYPFVWDEYENSKWVYLASNESVSEKCQKCCLLPTGCYHYNNCIVAQYKNKYTDMLQPSVAECQGPKVKIENYIQELDNNKLYIQLEGGDIN